ncbi:HAD family hydrolase [Streptomyces sp. NPDC054958]
MAFPTCVASSSSHRRLRHTLGPVELYPRSPDLFLHAAARMGVDPASCLVVEDSTYGVVAARAAGRAPYCSDRSDVRDAPGTGGRGGSVLVCGRAVRRAGGRGRAPARGRGRIPAARGPQGEPPARGVVSGRPFTCCTPVTRPVAPERAWWAAGARTSCGPPRSPCRS